LNVPIVLLHFSWGGAPVEARTNPEVSVPGELPGNYLGEINGSKMIFSLFCSTCLI